MRNRLHPVLMAVACAGWAGSAVGQSLPPGEQGTYVDQAVGDLDPLAASLRYIDPARAGNPNVGRVLLLDPGDATLSQPSLYRYVAPGVRASFERPEYLTWTGDGVAINQAPAIDGAFRETIPAGTVFDLTMPSYEPGLPSPQALRLRVDTRLGLPLPGATVPLDPRMGPLPEAGSAGGGPVEPAPRVIASYLGYLPPPPGFLPEATPTDPPAAAQPWVAQPPANVPTEAQLQGLPLRVHQSGEPDVIDP